MQVQGLVRWRSLQCSTFSCTSDFLNQWYLTATSYWIISILQVQRKQSCSLTRDTEDDCLCTDQQAHHRAVVHDIAVCQALLWTSGVTSRCILQSASLVVSPWRCCLQPAHRCVPSHHERPLQRPQQMSRDLRTCFTGEQHDLRCAGKLIRPVVASWKTFTDECALLCHVAADAILVLALFHCLCLRAPISYLHRAGEAKSIPAIDSDQGRLQTK